MSIHSTSIFFNNLSFIFFILLSLIFFLTFIILVKNSQVFELGELSADKFKWTAGKGSVGDTHNNFVVSNYADASNAKYVATLGSVNQALDDYPDPGKATRSEFGLVKLSDSITTNKNGDNSIAASQKAIYDVNNKIYRGMAVVKDSAFSDQDVGGFRYHAGNLYYKFTA